MAEPSSAWVSCLGSFGLGHLTSLLQEPLVAVNKEQQVVDREEVGMSWKIACFEDRSLALTFSPATSNLSEHLGWTLSHKPPRSCAIAPSWITSVTEMEFCLAQPPSSSTCDSEDNNVSIRRMALIGKLKLIRVTTK